jgi:plasmid stabilization system protein ParE
MPQVIFTSEAQGDLLRLRAFLRQKSPAVAKRVAEAIAKAVKALSVYPQMGRPAEDMEPENRELLIDFGDSGYVALYRHDNDFVTVLALKHQKEVGY